MHALLQGLPLYVQQWRALFVKRVLSARRDRLAIVIQLLVPIALVLVALWARHATDAFPQEPALTISRCVQKSFARQLRHAWGVLIKVPISAGVMGQDITWQALVSMLKFPIG